MLNLISGECPFCGQMKMLEVPEGMEEKDMRELIISRCDCDKAIRITVLKAASERINRLFGEESIEKGFHEIADRTTRKALHDVCCEVYDEVLGNTTIILPNGDKATISKTGTKLNISREMKVKKAV